MARGPPGEGEDPGGPRLRRSNGFGPRGGLATIKIGEASGAMETWLPSLFVAATLLAGCGGPTGNTGNAGPTYCAQKVGSVDSCEANATTGPVTQCGPQSPVCTPPNLTGGVWACCSSTSIGGGVTETACTPGGSSDASCPCAGCG